MGDVTKLHVVAVAAVKHFKSLINSYKGPPEGLRDYLLKRLEEKDQRADEILNELIDQLL